jgi:hypothetical protein
MFKALQTTLEYIRTNAEVNCMMFEEDEWEEGEDEEWEEEEW